MCQAPSHVFLTGEPGLSMPTSRQIAFMHMGGAEVSGVNLCPVCGPVAPGDSSRYCRRHLRELLVAIRALVARAAA